MALTENLISYWKLDEASGNALDAHGSNALTDTNTVTSGAGKINGARTFARASNEYFTIPDNASLSVGDIDFTLAAWVNLASKPGGVMHVFGKREGGGNLEYWIRWNNALDRFQFGGTNDGTTQVNIAADNFGAPSLSTWIYVVGWHDSVANTVNIQVNNGTVNSASHTTGFFDGTAAFKIGAGAAGGGEYWDGSIDEAAFWKRVLTAGERTSLYGGGNGLAYPLSTGSKGIIGGDVGKRLL